MELDMTFKSDNRNDNKLRQSLIDLTAGSLAGGMQVYVSQPMDTVKVKQQTFPHLYKNMSHCFVETYRKDGIARGLYAGTVPSVVASVAENAVLFAAYGSCQRVVAHAFGVQNTNNLSTLGNAFAGFLAAFFSTFALCPTELVKCKLQALREAGIVKNSGAYHVTPWKLTCQIYAKEGIPGFFRGLSSTFAREMPGYFFFFGGYECAREFLRKPDQTKDDIGSLKTMTAGAVGGIMLWTSILPADVIKSRIQVNSLQLGMVTVGLNILKKEGFTALYNGLLPSLIRTIPASATLFLVYEYSKKAMESI